MARLQWKYQTDASLRITVVDEAGTGASGGSGTVKIEDRDGDTLTSGAVVDAASGLYTFALANNLAGVSAGDKLTAEADITVATKRVFSRIAIIAVLDTA